MGIRQETWSENESGTQHTRNPTANQRQTYSPTQFYPCGDYAGFCARIEDYEVA